MLSILKYFFLTYRLSSTISVYLNSYISKFISFQDPPFTLIIHTTFIYLYIKTLLYAISFPACHIIIHPPSLLSRTLVIQDSTEIASVNSSLTLPTYPTPQTYTPVRHPSVLLWHPMLSFFLVFFTGIVDICATISQKSFENKDPIICIYVPSIPSVLPGT